MGSSVGALYTIMLISCRFGTCRSIQTRSRTSFRGRLKKDKYSGSNPGIQRRLKALASDPTDDIHDQLDEMESDFMKVNEMYDEHEREMQELKEQNQLKIVERKYFKTAREPNLLTWEEKKQMQYLHKSDPQQWTIEKLALSFPASESAVKKSLKAEWKPESAERILKYNQSVVNNWKLLKQGKLEISDDLKAHLSQFASRKLISLPPQLDKTEKSSVNQNNTSEFGNIIESYKALKSNENKISTYRSPDFKSISKVPLSPDVDTFLLKDDESDNKTHIKTSRITLDRYRKEILNSIESGCTASEKDKGILANYRSKASFKYEVTSQTHNAVENTVILRANKKSQISGQNFKNKIQASHEVRQPPEKIKIPTKCRVEGCLYKLEDCFYDEDGEFLYRVPGMRS